jgi:hypothetical protein
LNFEDHSWIKEENLVNSIKEKNIRNSMMENKSVQQTYFNSQLKDNPNQEGDELLNKFRKDFPNINYQVNARDITLIKQNLKRKNFEFRKDDEMVDDLITNKGKKFLREKVNTIYEFLYI